MSREFKWKIVLSLLEDAARNNEPYPLTLVKEFETTELVCPMTEEEYNNIKLIYHEAKYKKHH